MGVLLDDEKSGIVAGAFTGVGVGFVVGPALVIELGVVAELALAVEFVVLALELDDDPEGEDVVRAVTVACTILVIGDGLGPGRGSENGMAVDPEFLHGNLCRLRAGTSSGWTRGR